MCTMNRPVQLMNGLHGADHCISLHRCYLNNDSLLAQVTNSPVSESDSKSNNEINRIDLLDTKGESLLASISYDAEHSDSKKIILAILLLSILLASTTLLIVSLKKWEKSRQIEI